MTDTAGADSLIQRMRDGLGSNKYRAVDYNKLKATVSKKRYGSIKTSMKVAKIENASQQHKENTILKQHQLIWHKEFLRLQHLRKKAQSDIDEHVRYNKDSEICGQIYNDFDYFEAGLSSDFNAFKKATADPVWDLRDDLRYWLTEKREDVKYGSPDVIEEHAQVREMVQNVKKQQEEVMNKLDTEQHRLEAELQSETLLELCPQTLYKRPAVHEGIPHEAFAFECPDKKLKDNVLNEFLIIDEKFQDQLNDLADTHALALSLDHCGGWDPDEHFKFVAIHDQYPREMTNRRTLLFDRLKRHLKKKSYSQLSDHEDWWLDYKYYYEQLKAICTDWSRDKRELVRKVQIVFAEAAAAHEMEEVRLEYFNKHKQLCEVLYDKVKTWREQKMEAMQLQAQIDEEKRKEAEEKYAYEQELEKKRRSKEKEKVKKFVDTRDARRQEAQAAAEQRLQELQALMAEQAIYDQERIKFREEQLHEKIEEKKVKEGIKIQEEIEKEARLEALRAQVRIIAESDPMRAMQETKASQARSEPEQEFPTNKPLFDVHSFTANQITSDHRVRLEQKLREAGLHTTDYGRKMIRGATPPRVPRKDMFHTHKFSND